MIKSTKTNQFKNSENQTSNFKHNPKLLILLSLAMLVVTTVLTLFFVRSMISELGDEYNGLYRLIANIVAFLTIAESGIGAGIVQKSFQHYKDGNIDKVNKLFSASRKLFFMLGFVYIALFLGLSPVLAFILNKSSVFSYARIILVICILATKLLPRYFYSGNQRLMFMTSGKGAWIKIIEIIMAIIVFIPLILYLQFGIPSFGMFIIVLSVISFAEIISSIFIMICSKKYMSEFNLSWRVSIKEEIDFHALFYPTLIRVGGLVLVNTDELILGGSSYSIGTDKSLLLISVYSSYLVFFNLVNSILNNVFGALVFSVGANTGGDFSSVNHEKIKKSLLASLVVILGTFALISLSSPYVVNFVFNANDKPEYFSRITALLFGFMGLIYAFKLLPTTIYKIQGQWKKYAFLVIFEVVINIVLSLILVRYMGMNGLLISTIVAQGITMPLYALEYYKLTKQINKTKEFNLISGIIMLLVLVITFTNIFVMPHDNKYSLVQMFVYIYASLGFSVSGMVVIIIFGSTKFKIDFSKIDYLYKIIINKIMKKLRRSK